MGDDEETMADDVDQSILDFTWELFVRKMIWALQTACYLALLKIPDDYLDFEEICRIQKLFNNKHSRGCNFLTQRRHYKLGNAITQGIRNLRKRLGRTMELREKLRRGYHDDVTLRLMKVLSLEQADVHLVQVEIQKLEEKIEWMEKKLRTQNLANWRRRLQGVPGVKASWIKPTIGLRNVVIQKEEGLTGSKQETAEELRKSWLRLLDKVSWTEDEKERK